MRSIPTLGLPGETQDPYKFHIGPPLLQHPLTTSVKPFSQGTHRPSNPAWFPLSHSYSTWIRLRATQNSDHRQQLPFPKFIVMHQVSLGSLTKIQELFQFRGSGDRDAQNVQFLQLLKVVLVCMASESHFQRNCSTRS